MTYVPTVMQDNMVVSLIVIMLAFLMLFSGATGTGVPYRYYPTTYFAPDKGTHPLRPVEVYNEHGSNRCSGMAGIGVDAFGGQMETDKCGNSYKFRCMPVSYSTYDDGESFSIPSCRIDRYQHKSLWVDQQSVRPRAENKVNVNMSEADYTSMFNKLDTKHQCPDGWVEHKVSDGHGGSFANHFCYRDAHKCPIDQLAFPRPGKYVYIEVTHYEFKYYYHHKRGYNDDIVGVVCDKNQYIRMSFSDVRCQEQWPYQHSDEQNCVPVKKSQIHCKTDMRYMVHATGRCQMHWGRTQWPMFHGDALRSCEVSQSDFEAAVTMASPYLYAEIKKYPGYNGNINVGGRVTISSSQNGGLTVSWTLTGLEANAAQGMHVHAGTTCSSADMVLGHYWNTDGNKPDPWNSANIGWTSNAQGVSSGSQSIISGYSLGQNNGRAFVVHAADGTRIGCGVLSTTP